MDLGDALRVEMFGLPIVQVEQITETSAVPPYHERVQWLLASAAGLLAAVQGGHHESWTYADLEKWLSNFELHVCQIDHPDVIDPVAAMHRVRELCHEKMTNDTEDGSWTSVDTIWPTDILEALDGRGRWEGVGERVQSPRGTIDGEVTG